MTNLTPEQTTLLNLLNLNSYAWVDLNPNQQQLLSATLRPSGGFTTKQQKLLSKWYLVITPEQVATANATLAPLNMGMGLRQTTDGKMVVSADLLSNCMRQGDNYHVIAHILTTLPLIHLSSEAFLTPEIEDQNG